MTTYFDRLRRAGMLLRAEPSVRRALLDLDHRLGTIERRQQILDGRTLMLSAMLPVNIPDDYDPDDLEDEF